MGIDPSAALARARSQSRGRKRTRSEAPADVEMADAEQQKRLHSSKSRCCCLLAMEILFNQLCHNSVCLLRQDACDQDVSTNVVIVLMCVNAVPLCYRPNYNSIRIVQQCCSCNSNRSLPDCARLCL